MTQPDNLAPYKTFEGETHGRSYSLRFTMLGSDGTWMNYDRSAACVHQSSCVCCRHTARGLHVCQGVQQVCRTCAVVEGVVRLYIFQHLLQVWAWQAAIARVEESVRRYVEEVGVPGGWHSLSAQYLLRRPTPMMSRPGPKTVACLGERDPHVHVPAAHLCN